MKNSQQINKIQREILKKWHEQTDKGLARLAKSFYFFNAIDDEGNMVFSDHCAYTHEMRLGNSGADDFNRFVMNRLNLTTNYLQVYYNEEYNQLAEQIANDYVREQSSRLANFIVRINNLEITES